MNVQNVKFIKNQMSFVRIEILVHNVKIIIKPNTKKHLEVIFCVY